MARGTHGKRHDGTIAGLLNESDEASTAIKRKLGFEFRPVVYSADLLQLLRDGDVMQPATLVLSADYVLCTGVDPIGGEHTRFAGRSRGQRRHNNSRSPSSETRNAAFGYLAAERIADSAAVHRCRQIRSAHPPPFVVCRDPECETAGRIVPGVR